MIHSASVSCIMSAPGYALRPEVGLWFQPIQIRKFDVEQDTLPTQNGNRASDVLDGSEKRLPGFGHPSSPAAGLCSSHTTERAVVTLAPLAFNKERFEARTSGR